MVQPSVSRNLMPIQNINKGAGPENINSNVGQ